MVDPIAGSELCEPDYFLAQRPHDLELALADVDRRSLLASRVTVVNSRWQEAFVSAMPVKRYRVQDTLRGWFLRRIHRLACLSPIDEVLAEVIKLPWP